MSCQCIICRHERKEVSDEYFKGYCKGVIETLTRIKNNETIDVNFEIDEFATCLSEVE